MEFRDGWVSGFRPGQGPHRQVHSVVAGSFVERSCCQIILREWHGERHRQYQFAKISPATGASTWARPSTQRIDDDDCRRWSLDR
eukprot:136956-Pyramimonas_sp.AAC.1